MFSVGKKSKTIGFELHPQPNFSISKKKVKVPLNFTASRKSRIKTQGNQNPSSVFPLSLSSVKAPRQQSANLTESRKEYVVVRQHRLKKQYDQLKKKLSKGDHSLPLKIKEDFSFDKEESKINSKPVFAQNANSVSIKDIECNFLHLSRIFDSLLRKKDPRTIIERIKRYVLEDESDLNELQLCLEEHSQQISVKSILFFQRILLILLVQAIINKRYRFLQQNFIMIFKDFLFFYTLIYQSISDFKISKVIELSQIKTVLPHLPQKKLYLNFKEIKEKIGTRLSVMTKNHKDIDGFMNRCLGCIKSFQSNLLYFKLLQFYASKLSLSNWEGWNIQFLATCPSPYVHHQAKRKYTLLLDLDQTLVHFQNETKSQGQFLLRPHLFSFLSKLEPFYQIGIFTCALQSYADSVLEHLPSISFRLYRQHSIRLGDQLVKDLSRVGRDLSKTMLVDNLDKNFQLQKENGIHVRSWYGDPKDDILRILQGELVRLAQSQPSDLRTSPHKRTFL